MNFQLEGKHNIVIERTDGGVVHLKHQHSFATLWGKFSPYQEISQHPEKQEPGKHLQQY